ncbi:MAG: leucyl aminopeptidase [Bacteroidia bacterium]
MKITLFENDAQKGSLIVFTLKNKESINHNAPEEYAGLVESYLNNSGFSSAVGESVLIVAKNNRQIILCGCGKEENFKQDHLRRAIGKGLKNSRANKATQVAVLKPNWSLESLEIHWVQLVSETIYLSLYEYNKYLSNKSVFEIEEITIQCDRVNENTQAALKKGSVLGHSTTIARDLINEPAIDLYPETLAKKVIELGKCYGFDVQIFNADQCHGMGMHALMAVGQASTRKPHLIVMRWIGGSNMEPIGLIGKGVTYDTGGLSLKPTNSMAHMKSDMGGAANVIATMCALARLGSKKNVVGVVAAAENAVAGNAYKPGDVIRSMNGKTIEIGNTDAEGRLTLADAITYAIQKEHANTIIDIATLTGAVKVALGDHRAGIVSTDNSLVNAAYSASEKADEGFWQLPIDDEYRSLNSSEIGEIKNIGRDGLAGTITAAAFVEAFTENLPWLHIDIAGVCFFRKDHEYISKGGSGRPMRSLYHLVENL